ncbi:hypothetical protein E8E13_008850 [Curvularia kusanoi]|uniref:Uncharacterized protein n=1 Tax=Curvularia kusanoi TaxID=90978 RepID=A0A9P4WAD1_CURKU|nr:hypothetical protein E8E13_008850 [Curvularia kusanoi]
MSPSKPMAWVLTTSQDFTRNGVLQLGQVLTNEWDPNSAIFAEGTIPRPPTYLCDRQEHEGVDFSSMTVETVSFRTWLQQSLGVVPAGVDVHFGHGSAAWEKYRSRKLMVDLFQPNDRYAQRVVKAAEESRKTKIPWYRRECHLYLVTGLRILASGTSVDSTSQNATEYHAGAEVDATPANVPFQAGVTVDNKALIGQKRKLEGTSEFIYAYRLHKITKRRKSETSYVDPWGKGELHTASGGSREANVRIGLDYTMGELDESAREKGRVEEDDVKDVQISTQMFVGDGTPNDVRMVD